MKGLTNEEVINNRKKYGSNKICKNQKESFIKKLVSTLGDPIIKILLIALAVKTLFLFQDFDWYETVGIVIAIFLASFISTLSEYGSEKAFEQLQEDASKIKTKVKRNNKKEEINIDDVVVNDIVYLEPGDAIPADGQIIEGRILVNESNLNGEMKEKEKRKGSEVYRSTVVYSGIGIMQVKKVGNQTFYGKLAEEVSEKSPTSPLKLRLTKLAQLISKIGYVGAALVSISYLFSVICIENNFNQELMINTITNFPLMFGHILRALTLAVTIIVVAVPEGLPLMITLVLSSNMKRMLKSKVLVRKLMGIETAGNINILFTDKTGTITKGKLDVISIVDAEGNIYKKEEDLKKNPSLYTRVKLSLIANNESVYSEENIIGGNITDRALLKFFKKDTINYKIINKVPFNSENKYSLTQIIYKEKKLNLIKGAPEVIIDKCTHYYKDNQKKLLINKSKIYDNIKKMAEKGIRVIAFGITDQKIERVTLIGLAYIKDEVRPEAIEGLNLIEKAHIKTVMITGDNINTAKAIGKEVGLIKNEKDIILTSKEFNQY